MSISRVCQIYFTNLAELATVIIIVGLISGTVCIDCFHTYHKNQFVNGVVYGFLIVLALIVLGLFLTCDFSKNWSIIVAFVGGVCFFTVSILIFEYLSDYPSFADGAIYLRLLIAGLLCLILAILFIFNLYLLIKLDDECSTYNCTYC